MAPRRRDAKGCADFEERTSSDVEVTRPVAAGLPVSFGEIENDACGGTLELVGKVSIEAPNLPK